MAGSFIHTLVATDVCSGWTEFVPLLAREQSLVVEGLEVIFDQIPFPVLGIDSDNDSAFINDTLIAFCRKSHVEFTRSRPYHKNDQAWVEQKNGAVLRRDCDPLRMGLSIRSIVDALTRSTRLLSSASRLRWPWRSIASSSSGRIAFNRFPQMRSDTSHSTVRDSWTASSYTRRLRTSPSCTAWASVSHAGLSKRIPCLR